MCVPNRTKDMYKTDRFCTRLFYVVYTPSPIYSTETEPFSDKIRSLGVNYSTRFVFVFYLDFVSTVSLC
jgi:hypothetical protein